MTMQLMNVLKTKTCLVRDHLYPFSVWANESFRGFSSNTDLKVVSFSSRFCDLLTENYEKSKPLRFKFLRNARVLVGVEE